MPFLKWLKAHHKKRFDSKKTIEQDENEHEDQDDDEHQQKEEEKIPDGIKLVYFACNSPKK